MRTTTRQRWALAVTSAASFMVALDALVVSTALTQIRLDLGASLGELEWTVNAYTLRTSETQVTPALERGITS
ncbi:MAG: hypothetical protein WAK71_19920 [Streptosporangiaceae bacterium]